MQQRLRIAVDTLKKDLLMAGAGTYSGNNKLGSLARTSRRFFRDWRATHRLTLRGPTNAPRRSAARWARATRSR